MTIPKPRRATVPYLYRYSSLSSAERLEWLRIILQKHELYIPDLAELNDPADGRPKLARLPAYKFAGYLFEEFLQRNPNAPFAVRRQNELIIHYNILRHGVTNLQRIFSEGLNRELQDWKIYSMSKRYDNMNLWAKYADNHRGYCLEFANQGRLFEGTVEVLYTDPIEVDIRNPEHRSGYWLFCKKLEWSNEEEVRLVLPRHQGSKVKIDPHWLRRVILGKDMSEENQNIIRKWARERQPELVVATAYYDELDQMLRLRNLVTGPASVGSSAQ